MQRRSVLLSLLPFAIVACAPTGAPGGLYRVGAAEQSNCFRPVQTLGAPPPEAFEELATISAACPYTSPKTCDRLLLARACDLTADAIIVQESSAIGRRAKPQLVEEAIAIRFSANGRVR